MGAPRRFDHDEAIRRHAAGESVRDLAAEYGVTYNAVNRLVSPNGLEVERRAQAAFYERNRVPCEGCGRPCLGAHLRMKHAPDGRSLCVRCRADERIERLRFDEETGALAAVRCSMLDCANGERWQSPDNFTNGARFRWLREGGIHSMCRSCQTRARRDHRRRNREHDNAYQREYKRARRQAAA